MSEYGRRLDDPVYIPMRFVTKYWHKIYVLSDVEILQARDARSVTVFETQWSEYVQTTFYV